MVPLGYYLVLGALLFSIGLFGALLRTNAIMILMSIELMLNAVNINLVAFSRFVAGNATGWIFTVFVMAVAAAEAAVGLAIVLLIVRKREVIDIDKINLLKG